MATDFKHVFSISLGHQAVMLASMSLKQLTKMMVDAKEKEDKNWKPLDLSNNETTVSQLTIIFTLTLPNSWADHWIPSTWLYRCIKSWLAFSILTLNISTILQANLVTYAQRSDILEWLSTLSLQFQFYPEALSLSVSILDSFLSVVKVSSFSDLFNYITKLFYVMKGSVLHLCRPMAVLF